uniref:NR LBD domain-containing protein n=1 Tax=Acrobeloides nanus TaxID=290746 RepID=A0A914C1P1_9BILA
MKLSSIEEQVKGILAQPHAFVLAPGIRLIFMQQLEYGFNEYDEEIKPKEDLVILTEIDHEIDEKFNDRRTVALAKMLMYCKQFAELDFTDKLLLYKHLKDVFWDIERFYRSALLARNQSLFLLYDNRAVNLALDEPTFIKNSDKESFAKTLPLLYPVRDKMVNLLLNPIKSLNLSQTELVYLCAIILWTTIDINDISPNAQRVAEEVSEQILNGLHNYYVYEKHLVNYAPRLVKLLKLIDASKVVKSAFTDAALLSQVYNIYDFNVNLSELVNT